jgi:hypothetical protein
MPTNNTYQRGRAKEQVLRVYKGTQTLAVCRVERGLEMHQRAENVFLQNELLVLTAWCIMLPDAYRQHIPKEDGKGAGLQKVRGETVLERHHRADHVLLEHRH